MTAAAVALTAAGLCEIEGAGASVPEPSVPERVSADADAVALPARRAAAGARVVRGREIDFMIGASFDGSDFLDSGFIPPDTMGAAGPSHFVEILNGRFAVYDRDGVELEGSSLDAFFLDAGVGSIEGFAFDPRIVYDASSQRFFAVAVDGARSEESGLLVAVSGGPDPTEPWSAFRIDADTDDLQWADFPTVGVDSRNLYVSNNMFAVDAADFELNFLTVAKSGLTASPPTVAGASLTEDLPFASLGFALQPVIDLDNIGVITPVLGELNTSFGEVNLSEIVSTVSPAFPSFVAPLSPLVSFPQPPDASQPGTIEGFETGDTRFGSNVVEQLGSLWAVQTVGVDGLAALRWLRIDPATGDVLESGVLDSVAEPETAFFYGSIAVTEGGKIVVGCSGSRSDQSGSAYAFVGSFDGSETVFEQEPVLLREGSGTYVRLDSIGRNRWGDYSATMVDPADPDSIWTIQLFVLADDVWATHITRIDFSVELGCADTNDDDVVDLQDLLVVLSNFGNDVPLGTPNPQAQGDVMVNGRVDLVDLLVLLSAFGQPCP